MSSVIRPSNVVEILAGRKPFAIGLPPDEVVKILGSGLADRPPLIYFQMPQVRSYFVNLKDPVTNLVNQGVLFRSASLQKWRLSHVIDLLSEIRDHSDERIRSVGSRLDTLLPPVYLQETNGIITEYIDLARKYFPDERILLTEVLNPEEVDLFAWMNRQVGLELREIEGAVRAVQKAANKTLSYQIRSYRKELSRFIKKDLEQVTSLLPPVLSVLLFVGIAGYQIYQGAQVSRVASELAVNVATDSMGFIPGLLVSGGWELAKGILDHDQQPTEQKISSNQNC